MLQRMKANQYGPFDVDVLQWLQKHTGRLFSNSIAHIDVLQITTAFVYIVLYHKNKSIISFAFNPVVEQVIGNVEFTK